MADKWYEDLVILRDFADALENAGVVEDKTVVFQKPYRFQAEYEVWAENDYPDQSDETWDDFVKALSGEETEGN